MNDYMIEGLSPDHDAEPSWFEISEGQLPPIAWEGFRTRLRQATRTEQFWEVLFVIATFGLLGWEMFWLYEALQNFTTISLL
jgi:hypothetical protein